MSKKALAIVFAVYIAVILKLTLFRSATLPEREINLSLFTELAAVLKEKGLPPFLRLFLGNIGWFIPLGFLLPAANKKCGFLKVVIIGLCFSLFVEISQFILRKGVLRNRRPYSEYFWHGLGLFCIQNEPLLY